MFLWKKNKKTFRNIIGRRILDTLYRSSALTIKRHSSKIDPSGPSNDMFRCNVFTALISTYCFLFERKLQNHFRTFLINPEVTLRWKFFMNLISVHQINYISKINLCDQTGKFKSIVMRDASTNG